MLSLLPKPVVASTLKRAHPHYTAFAHPSKKLKLEFPATLLQLAKDLDILPAILTPTPTVKIFDTPPNNNVGNSCADDNGNNSGNGGGSGKGGDGSDRGNRNAGNSGDGGNGNASNGSDGGNGNAGNGSDRGNGNAGSSSNGGSGNAGNGGDGGKDKGKGKANSDNDDDGDGDSDNDRYISDEDIMSKDYVFPEPTAKKLKTALSKVVKPILASGVGSAQDQLEQYQRLTTVLDYAMEELDQLTEAEVAARTEGDRKERDRCHKLRSAWYDIVDNISPLIAQKSSGAGSAGDSVWKPHWKEFCKEVTSGNADSTNWDSSLKWTLCVPAAATDHSKNRYSKRH